jgi:glycosyltransferase involved in cell wall biosynthesis
MVSRQDVESVPGGDTIQMHETKAGLEKLGVDVTTATTDTLPHLPDFDILHLFNLDQLEPLLTAQKAAFPPKPPIVVSTIFWHHTGHWFKEAINIRRSWKLLHKAIGASRALFLYEHWQKWKLRWGEGGMNYRRQLSLVERLLPNSQIEVKHLQSVLGCRRITKSKITIIPNGVRRELFDPKPEPNRSFVEEYGLKDFVLEAARIQSAKSQLTLIEALFDLPVPIVFAGQPSPYEPEYVNRCHDLAKARGNTYFIGTRSPMELAGIYRLAAVHVLPSWRETPGLSSLEAAAAGCRVVSTDVGSAREYFGSLAWYCDPRNPQSIRKAVLQALETPPSDALRNRIMERYTWDIIAKMTLDTYHQALRPAKT